MAKATDETLLPFSKDYKGKRLIDVPESFLIWCHENKEGKAKWPYENYPEIFEYIEENLDALRANIKKNQDQRKYNNRYNSR